MEKVAPRVAPDEIVLTDGESLDVNLKRLSVEQRQNLWKAIAFHARLTQTR